MATARKRKTTSPASSKRLYVLDTNIALHDPYSLFKFRDQDLYIPFVTIEELDGKKAGTQDVNRNARQATRLIEEVVSQPGGDMVNGYPLEALSNGGATGTLYLQNRALPFLPDEHIRKNDNLYLSVLSHLQGLNTHAEVVMVTKDLNLRIKARALGFKAEDYLHDHALEDTDLVYKGLQHLTEEDISAWGDETRSRKVGSVTHYEIANHGKYVMNEFLVLPTGQLYRVTEVSTSGVHLESVADYSRDKNSVLGIKAKNEEQAAALNLLLDDDIDLVALLGPAGTGKTLMTVAAGLSQIVDDPRFDSLLFTRGTTPLGEDIGFLPGSETEKMSPWLGALWDNIEVIIENGEDDAIARQKLRETVDESVEVKAITFMRGRTFHRKFVVVDEAQNLTPKQMKALITRAGEGTKVVVMGNLGQIDSPYLSESSNGLTYLVQRFKGWKNFGALVMDQGERSRLATEANVRL